LVRGDVIYTLIGFVSYCFSKEWVTSVLNHKAFRDVLERTQRAIKPNDAPLTLTKFSNTRKWAAAFLMMSRVIRLQDAIRLLPEYLKQDKVASELYESLPNLDFDLLAQAVKLLGPFFLRIQILQRNASNIVHAAYFWQDLLRRVR
jgi:hypothetical protein